MVLLDTHLGCDRVSSDAGWGVASCGGGVANGGRGVARHVFGTRSGIE